MGQEVTIKNSRFESSGGGAKVFFSKLSRGLMMPVAILPVAGLFLGVGAGIENIISVSSSQPAEDLQVYYFFASVLKTIGQIIFDNLAILFCLGVVVAFTDDSGVAVFSGFVAWIVFNMTQSLLIYPVFNDNGVIDHYSVFWYSVVPASIITQNVGIKSLQTSVFGGITIGLLAAWLYNKFHTIKMPNVLGFFSGTRFVPIITFLFIPFISIIFLMIWPFIGIQIEKFGAALLGMPYGIDSFIFGVVERSLIPIGLHHAFYTPLWFTSAGGNLLDESGDVIAQGNQNIWFAMQSLGIPFNVVDGSASGWTLDTMTVDQLNAIGITATTDMWRITDGTDTYYLTVGFDPGSFMQGKYPIMLFGLPAAGFAMIMAAKKENRQVAISIIGAAILTSFLTGITEPIEFTFLFLAPVLYYGFHIWMAGLSFWLMDILNAHIGQTFSAGIIDFALFGILPDATGFHADSYWAIVIGVAIAPIYYFVFYYYITKKDIKTPGREEGDIKLMRRADVEKAKLELKGKKPKNNSTKSAIPKNRIDRVLELEKKLGGLDNLTSIDACITRLRISIKDRNKIDDEGLKRMGAAGVVGKDKAMQIIFGAEADQFKTELKNLKKERQEAKDKN